MKSRQFLKEAINPQLLQYVSSTPGFSMPATNLAVFAWDDKTLARLIKKGLNPGMELETIRTPQKGQLGLGIIDLTTSMGAVGAIDTDGGVFVVSSVDDETTGADARQFFRLIKNGQVRRIFSRLEDLEQLFKEKNKESNDSNDIIQKIKKANDEQVDDEYLNFTSTDPDEIREELENTLKKLEFDLEVKNEEKQKLKKQWIKFPEESEQWSNLGKKIAKIIKETSPLRINIQGIEDLLDQPELFKLSPKKSKDSDDKQIQKQIEQWLDSLNSDFQGLDVESAEQFIPE